MTRRKALFITTAGLGLVLLLTLWPSAGDAEMRIGFGCLLCGTRALADGLLNLLLFVPLGAGLALLGGPLAALGGSFALSGLVELAQVALPGRFPSLQDLLLNTAGGGVGLILVAHRNRLLRAAVSPKPTAVAASVLFPFCVFLATAVLSKPVVPDRSLYGQWTHEIGQLRPYTGKVLSAHVGEIAVPDGLVQDQESLGEALRASEPILVSFIVGPEPPELSHLFAVYDAARQEVLLLGVQGPDLLFRRRTRSVRYKLDQPTVLVPAILDLQAGDTVHLTIRQAGRDLCFEVNGTSRCNVSAGVEGGWRLLHRLRGADPWLIQALGFLWLAVLSIPAGMALGSGQAGVWRRGATAGLGIGALAGLVGWLSPWLSPHWAALLVPVGGALMGSWFRRFLPARVRGLHSAPFGG